MEARAEARYIRTSAQKARLVVDLIRGRRAGEAINILKGAKTRVNKRTTKFIVRTRKGKAST